MLQRFSNIIACVLLGLCCICAIVGTAGSQYSNAVTVAGVETKNWIYLYASQVKVGDGDRDTTYFDRDEFQCKGTYDKLTAAFALGLIGIIVSFIGTLIALLSFCCKGLRWPVFVLAILSTLVLIVAFAISVGTYANDQCDVGSFRDQDYDIDWGLIILIIGAGFALLSALFASCFCCRGHTSDSVA